MVLQYVGRSEYSTFDILVKLGGEFRHVTVE